ncbi:MAG: hypothetical protein WCK96_14855 [Methylococcales bacterium]
MNDEKLQGLKRLATTVYLCQLLSFALFGLPLLVGVTINFLNRNAVQGTWLESHFNWQIQTAWMALAGFSLAGFSTVWLGLEISVGLFLLPTILLLVYRIVIGWNALTTDRAVKESN